MFQHLDSQKVAPTSTSSICLILDYLSDNREGFTVYHAFDNLRAMDSHGADVILKAISGLWHVSVKIA